MLRNLFLVSSWQLFILFEADVLLNFHGKFSWYDQISICWDPLQSVGVHDERVIW